MLTFASRWIQYFLSSTIYNKPGVAMWKYIEWSKKKLYFTFAQATHQEIIKKLNWWVNFEFQKNNKVDNSKLCMIDN